VVDLRQPDWIDLGARTTLPMDAALDKAFAEIGVAKLGGASKGRGWSWYDKLQHCPYLYKRLYLDKALSGAVSANALEIGSGFHALKALYHQSQIPGSGVEYGHVGRMRDALYKHNASVQAVAEAARLIEAYIAYYDNDYLIPLDVEVHAVDDEGNSCRYDLIARVEDAHPGLMPGTYIVEAKTASRMDDATMTGWRNHGEIIGQAAIFHRTRLAKKYGRLEGVIVDVVTKTKQPGFCRPVVVLPREVERAHLQDLRMWRTLEKLYRSTGYWPRARAACIARYGKCAMFDECSRAEG